MSNQVQTTATSSLVRIALSSALVLSLTSNAFAASVGTGTFRTAVCKQATSRFITLAGGAKGSGFGGSDNAAQLVEDGSGTAGLNLNFDYTKNVNADNDFNSIAIFYNPDEKGSRKATNLHFCFQADHGGGEILAADIELSKIEQGERFPSGFFLATIKREDFGGLKVQKMVLRRLGVSLTAPGAAANITIGKVKLNTDGGNILPAKMNLNQADCNSIFSCPQESTP